MTKNETSNNDDTLDLEIWDKPFRAKGLQERNTAFECFMKYRDMGAKRSLKRLARQENIDYAKICNWSSNYQWNQRIDAMLQHENEENKKINAGIKKQASDMIVKRLKMKNELIQTIFIVLKKNAMHYLDDNIELDFNDFVSLFTVAMKLENVHINDMIQVQEMEHIFMENEIDTQKIQAMINNFNVVLTSSNDAAIDKYQEELKHDSY